MKKVLTLTLVLLFGFGFSNAEKMEDNRRYHNYTENFIFNLDGIEFAVFPDGQFDFNYLQDRNGVNVFVNTGNVNVSFNTGYDYNRFVQYDTYGAVVQIEQIPIFYDAYGRVNQIGDINVFYNNGYINRIGNLNVFYSRPGIINYHTGFINRFNRRYIYQPWHGFYSVPFANRCIVYNNPYRVSYFPIRYSWNHHRLHWNSASYYNGFYAGVHVRRNFYRPYDRVNYRSFERGRRDARGRVVALNNRSLRNRQAIASGRSQVTRNDRGRSVASTDRNSGRNTTAVNTRSNSRTGRSTTAINSRSNRSVDVTPRTSRSLTRTSNATIGTRNTERSVTTRSTRTNRSVRTTPNSNRNTATTRSTRSNRPVATTRDTSSRNTQARSTRSNTTNNRASRTTNSRRSNTRG
ncbi:MAG: hypothetical protein ABF247_04670 [Nonlabens sp.]|uniref:hypothetical protein n=1 Tax=Nonlabens sp. TaxID=1888209 RepID=UPI00321BF49F